MFFWRMLGIFQSDDEQIIQTIQGINSVVSVVFFPLQHVTQFAATHVLQRTLIYSFILFVLLHCPLRAKAQPHEAPTEPDTWFVYSN